MTETLYNDSRESLHPELIKNSVITQTIVAIVDQTFEPIREDIICRHAETSRVPRFGSKRRFSFSTVCSLEFNLFHIVFRIPNRKKCDRAVSVFPGRVCVFTWYFRAVKNNKRLYDTHCMHSGFDGFDARFMVRNRSSVHDCGITRQAERIHYAAVHGEPTKTVEIIDHPAIADRSSSFVLHDL